MGIQKPLTALRDLTLFRTPNTTYGTDLRQWFFKQATWDEVYDFVEFVSSHQRDSRFDDVCNYVLEREAAGYTLVDHLITPITDKHELAAIEPLRCAPPTTSPAVNLLGSSVTRKHFERLVATAVGTIPTRFRDEMDNVAVVVEDAPADQVNYDAVAPAPQFGLLRRRQARATSSHHETSILGSWCEDQLNSPPCPGSSAPITLGS